MQLKMIVAMNKTRGIGVNGKLPWKCASDLEHFSKTTIGQGRNAVIMGRKTWESLPTKPLPERLNIVLSRNPEWDGLKQTTAITVENIADAINTCIAAGIDDIWIIGGAKVYEEVIKECRLDGCVVTHLNNEIICDTVMPAFPASWKPINFFDLPCKSGVIIEYETPRS
jgi:dihydrofolate reductase